MTPLNIIFTLIISLISVFLCVQLLKLYRRFKRASDNTTANNIYVIKYNNIVDEDAFPEAWRETEPAAPLPEGPKGSERRRYPRTEFQGFVDFINKGTLYKTQAQDLELLRHFHPVQDTGKIQKKRFDRYDLSNQGGRPPEAERPDQPDQPHRYRR